MAEILGLGISHYPPLTGHDDRMSTILRRMLQNPDLPPRLRTPDGWPEAMRAEWGDDQGITSAAQHRAALVGWMERTRSALDAFNPDFVLLWGDDQYENFREDIIPPYCIAAYDKFAFSPPPNNVWGETDKTYEIAGNRRGFPYPIVPFALNCYGRKVVSQRGGVPVFDKADPGFDLDPPAPAPWRLFDLGAATGRILAASPYRVALLASSGWSHAFLTAKNHYLYPDTPADRRMYEHLRDGNYDAWRSYTADAIEDSGQQEILNWMCLTGALNALGRKPRETGFVDTWIFNSSKAFLIAPPGPSE
jgi:hypothetical protein